MADCYNGPNPVQTPEERMAIWRWAKANAIDHGVPFAKVHDMINENFFAGQGRPEWINDILSGRKTPFREVSTAAWKAAYNRRQIVNQATELVRQGQANPIAKAVGKMYSLPRALSVLGHFATPPFSHAGDLVLRPASWGTFFRGLINTWGKALSPAKTEMLLDTMRRQPLYDLAIRSGLVTERGDIKGILSGKGSPSQRAFSILAATRFELWNNAMQKYVKPDTPQAVALDYGKNFADWANHATGAAKGGLVQVPGIGHVLFGPSLTQSKLSRMFSDPAKTLNTFANWNRATPGEKAVAWTRLSGLAQYVGTGLGMLAVNQGYLMATGQKDKINFNDPTKGDWMKFKSGGLEFGLPGLHSELRTLGQILATTFMDNKAANKFSRGEGKSALLNKIATNYVTGKLNPMLGVAKEIASGQDFMGRPLPVPWASGKQSKSLPRVDWNDIAISHGPIPLTGPIRYIYDKWRDQGASAVDATSMIKGLIMFGAGFSGLHAAPDYAAEKEAAKRAGVAHALRSR